MGASRECQSCAMSVPPIRRSCPHCGATVADPDWDALEELRARIVGLDARLSRLLLQRQSLTDEYERHRAAIASRAQASAGTAPAAAAPAASGAPARAAPPARERQEWSGARVRALLLGLGAALLGISALTFTAVAWSRLGDGGRAGLLLAVTALVAGLALGLRRRLPMTAEAFAGLAVALVLIDVHAARRAGLGQQMSWQVWWAAGAVVAAGFAAALGRVVGRRTTRFATVALLPLAPALLACRLADIEWAAALTLAGLATLCAYAMTRWAGQLHRESQLVVGLYAAVSWLAAATLAGAAAFDALTAVTAVPAALAVAALFPAPALACRHLANRSARIAAATLAAGVPGGVLTTLAGWAGVSAALDLSLFADASAGAATLVVAAYRLPDPYRVGGILAGAVFAVPPTLFALLVGFPAVYAPLANLAEPWTGSAHSIAEVPGLNGWWPAVACLAATAAAALALGRRWPWVVGIGSAEIGVIAALAPPTAGATVAATLVATTSVFVSMLLAGAWIGRARPGRGWRLLPGAAVAAAPTAGWAAVSAAASVVTLASTALAAGGAALFAGAAGGAAPVAGAAGGAALVRRTARPLYAGLAAGLGVAFVGVAVRAAGAPAPAAGFAAVLAAGGIVCLNAALLRGADAATAAAIEGVGALAAGVGLVLAAGSAPWLAGALTALALFAMFAARGASQPWYAPVAAALALGAVPAWLDAAGVREEGALGFALAAAAAVVVLVGVRAPRGDRRAGVAVEGVGCVAAIAGALVSGRSQPWLAAALTVLAAAAAVAAALRADRRTAYGAASGGCALGAVWALLAAAGVGVVEAYTAPAAVVALAAGIASWRGEPGRSWLTLGPALVLAIGPTLLLGVADRDLVRLVFAAVLSLAVVVAGAVWRLQAPLFLGALALLVLAVDQWGDDIVRMPRWISLGAVGLLLMWVGATFERRRRDWRHATAAVGRFG